jgi:hypothetical protein
LKKRGFCVKAELHLYAVAEEKLELNHLVVSSPTREEILCFPYVKHLLGTRDKMFRLGPGRKAI